MDKITPFLGLIAFVAVAVAIGAMLFFADAEPGEEPAVLDAEERERGAQAILDLPLTRRQHRLTPDRLTISPDGRFVAGRSSSGLHVWDAEDGSRIGPSGRSYLQVGQGPIEALSYSPDSLRLAAVVQEMDRDVARIMIWDTDTGERLQTFEIETGDTRALAYSPDGSSVAWLAGSALGVWDPESGEARQIEKASTGGMAWAQGALSAPTIVTIDDLLIEHHDPDTLEVTHRIEIESNLHFVSFVGGGSHVIHAYGNRVELRDLRSGELVAAGDGFTPDIGCACAPPNLPWIALGNTNVEGTGPHEGRIQLWRPRSDTPGPIASVPAHEWRVLSMACGPDRLLVTSDDRAGKLWDVGQLEGMWPVAAAP